MDRTQFDTKLHTHNEKTYFYLFFLFIYIFYHYWLPLLREIKFRILLKIELLLYKRGYKAPCQILGREETV